MEFDFNWKYKDYELRMTKPLSSSEKYLELVKWQKYNGKLACFTLAFFKEDSEGYFLKFVGSRPFQHIEEEDLEIVWKALEMADNTLNEYYWKICRKVQM